MQKRIAEIVTKFASEGLAELRKEIRDFARDLEDVDQRTRNFGQNGFAQNSAANRLAISEMRKDYKAFADDVETHVTTIANAHDRMDTSLGRFATNSKKHFNELRTAFGGFSHDVRQHTGRAGDDIDRLDRRFDNLGTNGRRHLDNLSSGFTDFQRNAENNSAALRLTLDQLGRHLADLSRDGRRELRGLGDGFGDLERDAGRHGLRFRGHVDRMRASIRGLNGSLGSLRSSRSVFGLLSRDASRGRGPIGLLASGLGSVGRALGSIAKIPLSRGGLIGALIGLGAAGVKALITPALGIGAVGVAGLAGWWTSVDLKAVRQASESLGVPVDIVQQWQFFANTVDVTSDEIIGGMETLRGKITESLDPTSDSAKLFKKLGLVTRDTTGRMRPLSHVLQNLATMTQRMNSEQRGFVLENLLGDPTKFSELMRRVGGDFEALNAEFNDRKARGLFATPEQIEGIFQFRIGLQDLFVTIKALARELFVTFIPVFEKWGAAIEKSFSTVEKRGDFIQRFFVRPFQQGLQWIKDFSKVFFSFDIDQSIFGIKSSQIINTWMYTLRQWLWDLWSVAKGLGALFVGLGKAILAVADAANSFVLAQTGFDIEAWIKAGGGAQDVEKFFRDLGDIAANAFTGEFDAGGLRTALGGWFGGGVEDLKAELEPARAYVAKAMTEIWQAAQNGTGLEGVETGLAKIVISIGQTMSALVELGQQFYAVFFKGEQAGAGFEFLDKLKSTFDYVKSVLEKISDLILPIITLLGPEGVAKLLVAKFALDKISVTTLAVGAVVGPGVAAFGLGQNLLPDKTTRNDTPEAEAERLANDRAFDASGGAKPGARDSYARTLQGYGQQDRSFIAQAESLRDADMARQAAAAAEEAAKPQEPKEAFIDRMDVQLTGIPFIIDLAAWGFGRVNAIIGQDGADELVRANAALMGRR